MSTPPFRNLHAWSWCMFNLIYSFAQLLVYLLLLNSFLVGPQLTNPYLGTLLYSLCSPSVKATDDTSNFDDYGELPPLISETPLSLEEQTLFELF